MDGMVKKEEPSMNDMICELGQKNEVHSAQLSTEHELVDNWGVSSFVAKLWAILHDATATPYIKWADCSGERITIVDHDLFSTRILSRFEMIDSFC